MEAVDLINRGLAFTKKNPSHLVSLYKNLYGETICSKCPGTIEFYFLSLKNNLGRKMNQKYKMKEGKLITYKGSDYTSKNTDDKISEELIRAGYGEKFFINNARYSNKIITEKTFDELAEEALNKGLEKELIDISSKEDLIEYINGKN